MEDPKKEEVEEVAPAKTRGKAKKVVSFAMVNTRKRIIPVRVGIGANKKPIFSNIVGENSIINIVPEDKYYAEKVKFLRAHKDNGLKFHELSGKKVENKSIVDDLIDLDLNALRKLVQKKGKLLNTLTKGQLIEKILKEKGEG